MKILFISNFLNHHQKPLADCLYKQLGDDYHFVSCEPMPDKFRKTGYPDYENVPYNIYLFSGQENYDKVVKLVKDVDIMIIGGTNQLDLIEHRVSVKKIIIFYSERWHKRLRSYIALPLRWLNGYTYRRFARFDQLNGYMLCAGAYVKNDCKLSNSFKNRTFKWGYFPPFVEFDINQTLEKKQANTRKEIIWIARFIKWKHPEMAIMAINVLKKKGYDIHLTMIGGIDKCDKYSEKIYNKCVESIVQLSLEKDIDIMGNIPNEQVNVFLRKSDIFLFTSDRNEGWGAVMNEAMSNGCAVVAADMIGATPYLIEDNINGMIFKNKNVNSLCSKIELLLTNETLLKQVSLNGYNTIKSAWNPKIAASNLLILCSDLIEEKQIAIKVGPCSKA